VAKQPGATRFYVGIKDYRLTGLVEGGGSTQVRHAKRPHAPHYRARDWSGKFPENGSWLYGVEIKHELEKQGLTEIPTAKGENWVRRVLPVKQGLAAHLFDGCVYEARTTYEARELYDKQFFGKGQSTVAKADIRQVGADTRLGLVNVSELT